MQSKYRLKSARSFNYIYRRGKSLGSESMVLLYAPAKFSLRIGISVSSKVGNSVCRNHTKRLIRECVRDIIPNITDGFNYVIVAKNAIITKNFHDIYRETVSLFKRADKWTEK